MMFKDASKMLEHLEKTSPENAESVKVTMEVIGLWRKLQETNSAEERSKLLIRMKELEAI